MDALTGEVAKKYGLDLIKNDKSFRNAEKINGIKAIGFDEFLIIE